MGHKENFSRRGFFKAAAIGATGLVAGDYIRKIAYYSKLHPESTSVSAKDLESQIRIVKENSFRINSPENDSSQVQVQVNKPAFSEALSYLANLDDPQNGVSRIYSFLSHNPLKIKFGKGKPLERPYRHEKISHERATYTPSLYIGGPYITFNESYIESYYKAKVSNDYVNLALFEKTIYEEFFHLLQDSQDPKQFILQTANYNTQEFISWLGTKIDLKLNDFKREDYLSESEPTKLLENDYFQILVSQLSSGTQLGSFFLFEH